MVASVAAGSMSLAWTATLHTVNYTCSTVQVEYGNGMAFAQIIIAGLVIRLKLKDDKFAAYVIAIWSLV